MNIKSPNRENLQRRLDAALGTRECDLRIDNVRWLDVFSSRFITGSVSIDNGVIVGFEGQAAKQTINGKGCTLVPGFIDAHTHIESSMMLPSIFANAVVKRGTTTAICDPHEIANVVGTHGIKYFLDAATHSPIDLWVMLSSCVPATHLETNGGGDINADTLAQLAEHPRALGLAEMMNYPGVLNASNEVIEKLLVFANKPIDGHAPLLCGKSLSAYAAAGITSCHESSNINEAKEKIQKGMAVWIREGSVAKDAHALVPLLTHTTCASIGFCTDDRNPYDIAHEGHLDHVLRTALAKSIEYRTAPELVYRSASYNVARHYGLHQGFNRVGAIAPGYKADLVMLDDVATCQINRVFKVGVDITTFSSGSYHLDAQELDAQELMHTVKATVPQACELEGVSGTVHVITVEPGKIITGRTVSQHNAKGVCRLAVLERYGHQQKPANAYVYGFGELNGAIASSVGHDSHNLIVVGDNTNDMCIALAGIINSGGGFSVAQNQTIIAQLNLPYGGLMSDSSPDELAKTIETLKKAARHIGCILPEPFLQLAFLSLPVIPSLKLTNCGLVDVDLFTVINVQAS
ncbi:MAG: adenine deaminase [Deltaproteobacteria bacterium]|nr:adenine deaminase [Deltaproteobacteria bacterium]